MGIDSWRLISWMYNQDSDTSTKQTWRGQPRRQMMEKEQFEQLANLLKEMNTHLDKITSRLDTIDKSLDKIRNESKKKRKSPFGI